ncbi:MAG TPA: site-specific DNA-methyltransferase [Myxococcaceae bacterium]|nr:site-specific DNA-methyltransferase [Myxococcaceae bacterium]
MVVAGDARRPEVLTRALDGRRPALLLTDPPYCLLTRRRKGGDAREPRARRKIDQEPVHRFEDVRAYRRFTAEWLPPVARAVDAGGTLAIWTNFLGRAPILAVAAEAGFGALAGEFVWAKLTTGGSGNERLARVYEVALVLRRETVPPPAPGDGARAWAVVAGYDEEGEAARWGSHPNHKPFGVLEPLVRTWSRPGDLVLDCFAGSGSIPAAAVRLGREVACIELAPEWAARVRERLGVS